MFGFRVWSPQDMEAIDADDLSDMLEAAREYEAEQKKQAAEARNSRGR